MTLDPNIQQALGVILAALLTLLGTLISRIIFLLTKRLEAKVSADQWNLIEQIITRCVQAAEQYGILGVIENTGASKKATVLKALQAYLDEHHINVNAEQVDIILEAAISRGVHEQYPSLITQTVGATTTVVASNVTPSTTTS